MAGAMGIVRRRVAKSNRWHDVRARDLTSADGILRKPKPIVVGTAEEPPAFCERTPRRGERRRSRSPDRAVESEKRRRACTSSRQAAQGGPRQGAKDAVGGRTPVSCHGDPQRGQRSVAARPMRPMNAATDSMTSVSGGGASSAARAAARSVFLRAGDSRP